MEAWPEWPGEDGERQKNADLSWRQLGVGEGRERGKEDPSFPDLR